MLLGEMEHLGLRIQLVQGQCAAPSQSLLPSQICSPKHLSCSDLILSKQAGEFELFKTADLC